MNGLRPELARVGIRGRLAHRIALELEDHLRCDPTAPLGDPREIAERFAAELRVPRTRRSAYLGFAALTFAALAILASAGRGGGAPTTSGARGWIMSFGGLGIVLAGQVAFVAGVLALWRTWHRPRTPGELRLVQRSTSIALGAGGVVLAARIVQIVAVQPYASTAWLALAIPATIVPGLALAAAAHRLHEAAAVTPVTQPIRVPFPNALVVAIGAVVVTLMGVGSAFAERSWNEGLNRAVLEGIAFALGFVMFGRRLGIRS